LIAHDAVQNTTGLLGHDTVHVQFAGTGEGFLDVVFGNGVKDNPEGVFFLESEHFGQMPGNSFSLAVQVGCQIDSRAFFRLCLQCRDGLFAAHGDFIGRLEIVFQVDIQPLGG